MCEDVRVDAAWALQTATARPAAPLGLPGTGLLRLWVGLGSFSFPLGFLSKM